MELPTGVEEPTTSPAFTLSQTESQDLDFCDACKSINWSELADGDFRRGRKRIRVVDRTCDQLRTSQCRLCQLLALIKPPNLDDKRCWLSATSSLASSVMQNGTLATDPKYQDCTYLTFELEDYHENYRHQAEQQHIAVLKDGYEDYVGTRRIIPNAVDYDFVQESLGTCAQEHPNCRDTSAADVSGLLVVDCMARLVVPAPEHCQYLALSYVWGEASKTPSQPSDSGFVPVIEDSIRVTLALGHQYLWVDRLCISESGAHKTKMINSMDLIYSKAFLTIIAAAGEDAHHGLPGVGKTPRHPQAVVRIGDVCLVQCLAPHPGVLLMTSKWSTRGWACQEGFLSRRRLIFTDQQAVYVCRDLWLQESVKRPKKYEYALDNLPLEMTEVLVPSFRERLNNRTKETTMYLKAHLEEYSRRDLRFEEDALRAFLGVLSHYVKKGAYHIWGLPVVRWGSLKQTVTLQMDWYHPKPAKRRRNFPSWSWAGWQGPICWTSDAYRYEEESQIALCGDTGDAIPIPKLEWRPLVANKGDYAVSKRLATTSRVMPLTFQELSQQQSPKRWQKRFTAPHYHTVNSGIFAVFPWTDDLTVGAQPYLDKDTRLENGTLGLILHMEERECKHSKGVHSSTSTILILQAAGDSYERIGLITLDINEAPIYLNKGQVLEGMPNMLSTPDTKRALWYRNSGVQTIHLV